MHDFENYRVKMVDNQIRPSDVTDPDLLSAMLQVPREAFVPEKLSEIAYIDEDLDLGNGRYLMEPAPFAKLVQACSVGADDIVLDIGCASGYSTAVLSHLASLVIGLEPSETLAQSARNSLSELDYDNTAIIQGKLEDGHKKEAPYDIIFVGGAIEEIPDTLFDQLKEGGRLVAVKGYGNAGQAMLYTKTDGNISARAIFNSAIMPLPGFTKTHEFSL